MTQQEVIKAFMKSLDKTSKKGSKALDAAIKACSPFSSFQTAKNAIIRDCKNAKNADDFLKTYCGIDLDNDDTGAITGSDAGGSTIKTAESIVPEEGSLVEFNDGDYFDNIHGQNGLVVQLAKRTGSLEDSLDNIAVRKFSELSKQEIYLWRSAYTWWIRNGLDLISESYGDNFSFDKNKSSATNKNRTLYVIFEDLGDNDINAQTWYDTQKNRNLIIRINLNYFKTATGKDGIGADNTYLDRIIAHELTHAVMSANINYYAYLPAMIREGMAELTQGVSDDYKNDIKRLAGNSSLLSKALVSNKSTVSVSGINNPSYAGGYIFLRYLARQAGDLTIENSTSNKTVQSFYGNDTVTNYASGVSISSGAGNDSVSNWDWNNKYVTIQSGSGNDTISNVGSYSTLDGGTGNDSIHNWSDNVKITCGSGNDTVLNVNYYGKGNKVTIDGGAGNDYIDNYGNNVSIVGGTGNDTIWSYGLKATINGGSGNDYLVGDEGANKIIGGSGNDKMWGEDGNDSLKGDAGNDWLIGGDGNDTLRGGKGNDSLWGGDGKDTFIYAKGDGKDIIYGFGDNDLIKITGTFSASYSKSKDEVYFKVGTTSKAITLSDFTATTFHVNSSTYRISGSKLVKK